MRIGGGAVSIADVTDRNARDLGFVRPFWLNEIRAGRAFSFASGLDPSVGNNSHIQLINPAGSGITVILFDLWVSITVTGLLQFHTHNTELTLISTGTNLLAGGSASVAEIRRVDNAGLLGTAVNQFLLLADTPFNAAGKWLWELGAGEGILVVPGATNNGNTATYRWIEV